MDPATSRTLQLQLEATLRLLILLSPMLSSNDVMMARIRLTESDIILGQLLAERDAAPNNSKLSRPQPSLLIGFIAVLLNVCNPQQLLNVPAPEITTLETPALLIVTGQFNTL